MYFFSPFLLYLWPCIMNAKLVILSGSCRYDGKHKRTVICICLPINANLVYDYETYSGFGPMCARFSSSKRSEGKNENKYAVRIFIQEKK